MPKKIIAFLITIIFFDRLFKSSAVLGFFDAPVSLLGDFFKLNFSSNFNIAFSLPVAGRPLEIIILTIILALAVYLVKLFLAGDYQKAVSLAFVWLGAASNLYDRLVYGYVIDYLDLKYFTAFNLADAMIAAGTAGLIYLIIKKKYEKLS